MPCLPSGHSGRHGAGLCPRAGRVRCHQHDHQATPPARPPPSATTVYQLWRTNDEAGAMRWVLVDIVISAVVLLAVNLLEENRKQVAAHES
ncbi:MAG: hypothetical protein ACLVJH_17740 [Faecalibacterium prausnitzii]